MPVVRSFAVGDGDMFYIDHGSDNFTIIDCQLFGDHEDWLAEEIKGKSVAKGITRFISTHPDEDHIQGLEYLDDKISILNFYVVNNAATKTSESVSFKRYKKLRDGSQAFYVEKGCKRKWMNLDGDGRGTSGISILWPDTSNADFKNALIEAANGTKFNNMSLVARYSVQDGASFMWIGDLETDFMSKITNSIDLQPTTVVFAPHHGRKSGKLPDEWLDQLNPKIIVLGEAESRYLHYYTGYDKITQTKAWDITFETDGQELHCYSSNPNYGKRYWLNDRSKSNKWFGNENIDYYIGTLST